MKELETDACQIEESLRLAGTMEMLKKDDSIRARLIEVGEPGHRFNGMAFFKTLLGLTAYIKYFIIERACNQPHTSGPHGPIEIRAENNSKAGDIYAGEQRIGRVELLNAVFETQQFSALLTIARTDR